MSKAVSNGAHWLPRSSQFSLHGQRNGRVDVLPPDAKMPTFGELEQRYTKAKEDYRVALAAYVTAKNALNKDPAWTRHAEYFHANKSREFIAMPSKFQKRLDELKVLKDRLGTLGASVQTFRSAFLEEMNTRYERAWIDTAKLMLPYDVVAQISDIVKENLERSVQRR
jgi:recombinational DNA repair ATPase RecF